MHGIVNRFVTHPGQRDALAAAMTSAGDPMPGCHSFTLMRDLADPDVLWLVEVWESKAHWEASLKQPGVGESLDAADRLVKDWGKPVETEVIAG